MRYDDKYGGFGGAPKFPTPVHIRPLLRVASYPSTVREIVGEDECIEARSMAVVTLEKMAKGGIKDQIGHGFARYSVSDIPYCHGRGGNVGVAPWDYAWHIDVEEAKTTANLA